MLHRAELLDAGVSAVVVGHQKALVGDNLPGASAPELHDGVFEGGVVYAVDLLCGQPAAFLLHHLDVHFLQKRQHPHAFICFQPCR